MPFVPCWDATTEDFSVRRAPARQTRHGWRRRGLTQLSGLASACSARCASRTRAWGSRGGAFAAGVTDPCGPARLLCTMDKIHAPPSLEAAANVLLDVRCPPSPALAAEGGRRRGCWMRWGGSGVGGRLCGGPRDVRSGHPGAFCSSFYAPLRDRCDHAGARCAGRLPIRRSPRPGRCGLLLTSSRAVGAFAGLCCVVPSKLSPPGVRRVRQVGPVSASSFARALPQEGGARSGCASSPHSSGCGGGGDGGGGGGGVGRGGAAAAVGATKLASFLPGGRVGGGGCALGVHPAQAAVGGDGGCDPPGGVRRRPAGLDSQRRLPGG